MQLIVLMIPSLIFINQKQLLNVPIRFHFFHKEDKSNLSITSNESTVVRY
jgi:hypothetical protein